MKRYEFTIDQEKQIINLYESGKQIEQIANIFNISKTPISKLLKNRMIDIRDNSHKGRKYPIDETYFDNIDTANKAYVLGLLYSDGCNCAKLNHVKISLQERDAQILFSIIEDMQADRPLRIQKLSEKNSSWQDSYTYSFVNKHLSNHLIELGVVPKKSHILTFPNCVPEKYLSDFVRGYFDGDGHIEIGSHYFVTIAGTLQFCEGLQKCLKEKLNIDSKIYNTNIKESNIKILFISKKCRIYKFLNWIYDNSIFHIDRKYKSYLFFKDTIMNACRADNSKETKLN